MKTMKMSKKKYIEFYSALTGHTKSFVERNIKEDINGYYDFSAGMQRYRAWVLEDKIYCQYDIGNECMGAWWFDFDTFEYDSQRTEKDRKDDIESIIFERKESGIN